MRYIKTVTIQTMREIDDLQIGQWFKLGQFGHPAQWMGKASSGKDVIRVPGHSWVKLTQCVTSYKDSMQKV